MRKIHANLVLSLASLSLSVLSAEGLLRMMGLNCRVVDAQGNGAIIYDGGDFYHLKPNFDGRIRCTEFSNRIQTNSEGFRDDEFSIPSPRGTLLFIGDSFIFGHGVERAEGLVDHLEHLLKSPVYNMGVGGYSPKHYGGILQKYLPTLKPARTLVGIYLGNDPQEDCGLIDRVAHLKRGAGSPFKAFLKNSYLVIFMEPYVVRVFGVGISDQTSEQFYHPDESDVVKHCWAQFEQNLVKIGNHPKLSFVLMDARPFINSVQETGLDTGRKLRRAKEICSRNHLDCIDLATPMREWVTENGQGLFLNDGHWNPLGGQVAAEILYSLIK